MLAPVIGPLLLVSGAPFLPPLTSWCCFSAVFQGHYDGHVRSFHSLHIA